ncbi:YsnF/AvaK domain-containing protein [Hymenobacter siberiensis]|uniref:YsnF/AvaK domain-containing protein n=1 Tax=Hymenobacter siberiensis TaxID=2848396 RepID=UPI001C1E695C|nr:YsnF/AvaK domain-containing protein [Hymenobacter siberiensis]MBU6123362.1 YsnF/AvaK domain-containing protein [Hymenobacter siberiensis]
MQTPDLPPDDGLPVRIPVVAETLRVDKQVVETGRVVLHKTVHVETQTADVPLREEQVQVQRVAVGRYVDEAPAVRYEGDTMIVPVLREELVVTKRLLLVEEVHVRTQTLTIHAPQAVELRREELHYERLATPPAGAAPPVAGQPPVLPGPG